MWLAWSQDTKHQYCHQPGGTLPVVRNKNVFSRNEIRKARFRARPEQKSQPEPDLQVSCDERAGTLYLLVPTCCLPIHVSGFQTIRWRLTSRCLQYNTWYLVYPYLVPWYPGSIVLYQVLVLFTIRVCIISALCRRLSRGK